MLEEPEFGHDEIFPVNAYTLGLNYDLLQLNKIRLAAGTQVTVYDSDKKLDRLYGKNPSAFEIYLRLYPSLMKRR